MNLPNFQPQGRQVDETLAGPPPEKPGHDDLRITASFRSTADAAREWKVRKASRKAAWRPLKPEPASHFFLSQPLTTFCLKPSFLEVL